MSVSVNTNDKMGFITIDAQLLTGEIIPHFPQKPTIELTTDTLFAQDKHDLCVMDLKGVQKTITPHYSGGDANLWLNGFAPLSVPHITLLSRCDVSMFDSQLQWSHYINSVMQQHTSGAMQDWINQHLLHQTETLKPRMWLVSGGEGRWYVTLGLRRYGKLSKKLGVLRQILKKDIATDEFFPFHSHITIGCVADKESAVSLVEKLELLQVFVRLKVYNSSFS